MRIFKVIAKIIGSLLCATVLAMVVAAAGYRIHGQHVAAERLSIETPNGIVESGFQSIGGIEQWIQIRGEDRSNPVILFLHGGPSLSMIPFTWRTMRVWEKQFTIVNWEQRGAGRTYTHNGGAAGPVTGIDQLVSDGIDVAKFARQHLHKSKIILVGESFGTIIGTEMARRRPDLFYAYVGTGQIVNMAQTQAVGYRLLKERVHAAGDEKAAARLQEIGPPPYSDSATSIAEQQIMSEYAPISEQASLTKGMGRDFISAPGYSLHDLYDLIAGATRHRSRLVKESMDYDAVARGTRFEIPMFFIQGSEDLSAPTELVAEYLDEITAPLKELAVIPGGGHNSFYGFSDLFLHELVTRVRPLCIGTT